jgi:beta-galactosidase
MLHSGTAWYPEHWPEERWPRDIALFQAAHFTVIRLAEFAWSTMEPSDGVFEFAWLRRALDLLNEAGLKAVLCTPTATPPAWLTGAHPDILAVKDFTSGAIQPHGERCHYDPTNATYRHYCERIVRNMAEELSGHPAVLGWQTDNEFGPEFGSIAQNPGAIDDFRRWCLERFGGLEALNEQWSTAFWSQTYSKPQDIVPPLPYPNPALYLSWYRWASDAIRDFQDVQLKTLRACIPAAQWICHNFHPFDDLDRTPIAADLDVIGWDAYIYQDEDLTLDPALSGRDADRCRDLNQKKRPFWILETMPGFVNWRGVNRHAEPGETRSMAWHLIGHGADAVLYWQWRSAPSCQEQYHGCLLQQDGEPRPVYHEVAQLAKEFQHIGHLFTSASPVTEIALVDRWCDRMILRNQPHHQDYDAKNMPVRWYRPAQNAGFGMKVLEQFTSLPTERLVLAPQLNSLDHATSEALLAYVHGGGHLLIGPRFGMKNQDNALLPQRQPGPLAAMTKASVSEYYSLPEALPAEGALLGKVEIFAERWEFHEDAEDLEILARYGPGNGWLTGQPVVFSRACGTGRITVCTGCPDAQLAQAIIDWATTVSGLAAPLTPPEGVEVCRRIGPAGELALIINHNAKPATIPLPHPMRDHLSSRVYEHSLEMDPYAVAVLQREEEG